MATSGGVVSGFHDAFLLDFFGGLVFQGLCLKGRLLRLTFDFGGFVKLGLYFILGVFRGGVALYGDLIGGLLDL